MKLVSYIHNGTEECGIYNDNRIFRSSIIDNAVPTVMREVLNTWDASQKRLNTINEAILRGDYREYSIECKEEMLLAPVPHPTSCRDGYAFRQHVEAARRNRKVSMIEEFDQYPIFYFTNHNAVQGPGEVWCMPDHFEKLDFELEASVVLGRRGKNVRAANADDYIAGYMIMNDMSARTLQMEEMLLNLGPAKGKDFSTVIGPWMVTPDELDTYRQNAHSGHEGNLYNLEMSCKVNGIEVSKGNTNSMDWTFAEIIERCAYGVEILPGDVIGSGTVGTGCFLELNGTGLLNDPGYKPQWLKENDVVEMEITGLGKLKNTIRKVNTDYSILKLKKQLTTK